MPDGDHSIRGRYVGIVENSAPVGVGVSEDNIDVWFFYAYPVMYFLLLLGAYEN